MTKVLATALALGFASTLAFANAHKEAPMVAASGAKTAQQEKMATCNKEAAGKKGDERKAFMSTCLSAAKESQQDKMKRCSAENKGKKGDEYKAAQSACLKA